MANEQPSSEEALLAEAENLVSQPQQAQAAVVPPVVQTPGVQEPVVVDPNAPQQVVEPVQPQADDAPDRIRLTQYEAADRARVVAADALVKGEGISFGDAWNRVNGTPTPQVQIVVPEPVADPRLAINEELGQIQTRLAKAAGDGSYLTPEILADFDRKAELQTSLQTINFNGELAAREQAQVASSTWEEQWEASVARSESLYNDAKNPDSALCRAVGQELDQIAANRRHPLHGNSDLPRLLFAKHAADMGIAPNKQQQVAKPAQTRMLPASGQASITPVVPQNPAQQQQQFQERQRQAALNGDDEELAMLAEEELTGKRPAKHAALRLG